MANKPTCYFCQEPVRGDAADLLCSGCKIYICDGDTYACGSRISPFMRPKHKPEDHVLPCGTCGEARCDDECRICGEEGCENDEHRLQDLVDAELPRPPRVPTVAEVEKAIGIKAKDWNGNCYAIACKLVESGLVQGEARYGLFWGHISDRSEKFGGRSITHHGWVERPDRTVVDPTRWAFEARPPYIWNGWNDGTYDVGGSALYDQDPLPKMKSSDPELKLKLDKDSKAFAVRLLKEPPRITREMGIWLAHRSPDALGRYAKPIYQALIEANLGAYIPMDMRTAVFGRRK